MQVIWEPWGGAYCCQINPAFSLQGGGGRAISRYPRVHNSMNHNAPPETLHLGSPFYLLTEDTVFEGNIPCRCIFRSFPSFLFSFCFSSWHYNTEMGSSLDVDEFFFFPLLEYCVLVSTGENFSSRSPQNSIGTCSTSPS